MMSKMCYSHGGEIDINKNQIFIDIVAVDTTRNPVTRFPLLLDTGAFMTLIGKERADTNGYKTPHDDNIPVTEVLGMNILENFSIGLDFDKSEIYLNSRNSFTSQKPKYQCGSVSLFLENSHA